MLLIGIAFNLLVFESRSVVLLPPVVGLALFISDEPGAWISFKFGLKVNVLLTHPGLGSTYNMTTAIHKYVQAQD